MSQVVQHRVVRWQWRGWLAAYFGGKKTIARPDKNLLTAHSLPRVLLFFSRLSAISQACLPTPPPDGSTPFITKPYTWNDIESTPNYTVGFQTEPLYLAYHIYSIFQNAGIRCNSAAHNTMYLFCYATLPFTLYMAFCSAITKPCPKELDSF